MGCDPCGGLFSTKTVKKELADNQGIVFFLIITSKLLLEATLEKGGRV